MAELEKSLGWPLGLRLDSLKKMYPEKFAARAEVYGSSKIYRNDDVSFGKLGEVLMLRDSILSSFGYRFYVHEDDTADFEKSKKDQKPVLEWFKQGFGYLPEPEIKKNNPGAGENSTNYYYKWRSKDRMLTLVIGHSGTGPYRSACSFILEKNNGQ